MPGSFWKPVPFSCIALRWVPAHLDCSRRNTQQPSPGSRKADVHDTRLRVRKRSFEPLENSMDTCIGADFQQKRISRSLSYLKAIIAHQNLAVSPTNRYLPSTSYTPAAMLPFTSSGLATKPMTGGFLSVKLLTPSLMWRCSVASMPVSRSR